MSLGIQGFSQHLNVNVGEADVACIGNSRLTFLDESKDFILHP